MRDYDRPFFKTGIKDSKFRDPEVEREAFMELSNDLDLMSDKSPPIEVLLERLDPIGPEL